MLLISLKNAVNSIPVTDEDLQLMSKDTTKPQDVSSADLRNLLFSFLTERKNGGK